MQNIVTLGQINDALKITSVTAAQLAEMGFAALENKPICEALPPEESRRLRNAKLYQADSIVQIRVALAKRLAAPASCLHQIQEPPTKTEALAHYSQQAILAMGEAGAVALTKYLKDCDQHSIVPDVGGAFAFAFAAGFNLATPQAAPAAVTGPHMHITQRYGAKLPDGRVRGAWTREYTVPAPAALAALAAPDDRAAFERELIDNHHYVPSDFSFKDGFYGGDDDYIQFGWDVWKACAALAATPAHHVPDAGKMIAAADVPDMHSQIMNIPLGSFGTGIGDIGIAYRAGHQAARHAAAELVSSTLAAPAAAAPVVLPEPDAAIKEVMGLVEKMAFSCVDYGHKRAFVDPDCEAARKESGEVHRAIESKLRALLAGESAPAAQREPVAWLYTHKLGGVQAFTTEPPPGLKAQCQPLYTAPQAQAGARDEAPAATDKEKE